MWFLIARSASPDAPYWPGRRWLAAVDALAWPLLWVAVIRHVPASAGVAGPLLLALAALSACRRTHRALWVNHRYRFTTWRWGKVVAALLMMGVVLKLALVA